MVQCVRRIYQASGTSKQVLVIEGQERNEVSFLPLNNEVCTYFARRYHGLDKALKGLVDFRNVKAFDYLAFRDNMASFIGRSFRAAAIGVKLEREMGIEPTSVAWEVTALPLSYTRASEL